MNINKYESTWSSIIEYTPTYVGTPSLWDIFDDIFDDYNIKRSLKKRIISRCAPFCPLYAADTTSDLQYWLVQMRNWGDMHKIEWKKAWEAYTAEYDPIENYSRTKHETDIYDMDHPNDTAVTAYVAPESSETFYNQGKTQTSGGISDNGSITIDSTDSGNVGVTTSQQMIQSELDLRAASFIETYIIRPFVYEFAVAVY